MLKITRILLICLLSILGLAYNLPAQQSKKRIISLTPASTEILFALGLDEEVVGVCDYCNWPQKAKYKQRIGSFSRPNIEKIISLSPDLVILTSMEQGYLKAVFRNLGIDYIVIEPENLKELTASIREVGVITGRHKEADELIKGIDDLIGHINKIVSSISLKDRPRVYVEIWHDPIMSTGRSSFLNDMIIKAGGINITGDLDRSFSKIDPEVIIYNNPDVIILTYMHSQSWIKENFARRIGWAGINAVKNSRIYSDINPDIILRPGPRVKEGLIELHKRFYER